MELDPERLKALAEAAQARREEDAARELARFKSERLASLVEWLTAEAGRAAGSGVRSATLRFHSSYCDHPEESASSEPAQPASRCWRACLLGIDGSQSPGGQFFWVGPCSLPIDRVAACVAESAQKAGVTAAPGPAARQRYDVALSW